MLAGCGVGVTVSQSGGSEGRQVHVRRASSPRPAHLSLQRRPGGRTPVTVAWVGDMTLGSRYGVAAGDGDVLFSHVRSTLRRPHLTFGNLEGTLGSGGSPKCAAATANCYAFQASPRTARALRRAGFDGVNQANNHANDFGAV